MSRMVNFLVCASICPLILSSRAHLRGDDAENHRKGILFFLKSLEANNAISSTRDAVSVAGDSGFAGRYKKDLADVSPASKKESLKMVKDKKTLLYKVVGAGKVLLENMRDTFKNDAAEAAFKYLFAQLPNVVATFMTKVLESVLMIGDVVSIGKNLKRAAKAAWDTSKTSKLATGIKSGTPLSVIKSVRDQIKAFGLGAFSSAVQDALVFGLKLGVPGVGEVLDWIKKIFEVLVSVFIHFHDMWKLDKVIVEAKTKYQAKLYTNADAFQAWYVQVIEDMPIISSYCLAMPMTGSYNNFLSAVSGNGKQLSAAELKNNFDLFKQVQANAKKFVKSHSVKLRSKDATVMPWLKAVQ